MVAELTAGLRTDAVKEIQNSTNQTHQRYDDSRTVPHFQGCNSPLSCTRTELLPDAIVPAGDVHMEGVVTAGFGVCCFMPFLKGGQQAGPRFRTTWSTGTEKYHIPRGSGPKLFQWQPLPAIIITTTSNISITTATIPYPPSPWSSPPLTPSRPTSSASPSSSSLSPLLTSILLLSSHHYQNHQQGNGHHHLSLHCHHHCYCNFIFLSSPSLSWLLIECLHVSHNAQVFYINYLIKSSQIPCKVSINTSLGRWGNWGLKKVKNVQGHKTSKAVQRRFPESSQL